LPLRVVSAYSFLVATLLLLIGVLLVAHVRRDPDPDGIWLVPSTGVGFALVGVLVRRPDVRSWLTVVCMAVAAIAVGVPSRLAGGVILAVQVLPSSLRHVGLLDRVPWPSPGRGSGLGRLTLVLAIAELHGGTAHSANRGDGADAWLSLPC
jgi:hypothetical protein